MTKFFELLTSGISLGFIYALIALGFVIIFKATEVVNFAQGSLLLLAGYVVATLGVEYGFSLALLAGIVVTVVVALLVERLFIRPLRKRDTNPIIPTILTIGVDIIILTEITRRLGADVLAVGNPAGNDVLRFASIGLPETRLWAIIVVLVLLGSFLLAYKFTNWGVAMRASAEDSEAAMLMGVRRERVSMSAWIIAGVVAAVAAVFFAAFPSPGLTNTTGLAALNAFPAAILGGLDSTGGVLLGGVVIGVAETLVGGYANQFSYLGGGIGGITPWVIMLIVLLIRPSGLFGTREATRV